MTSAAPSTAAPQNILGGIALRLLAMASLSLMFVVVKYIDRAGIHIVESLFWRQALVLPFLLLWVKATGAFASLRTNRIGAHTRRMVMGLTGMACNFGAMILLPMAEATTISLSVPIFAVILPLRCWRCSILSKTIPSTTTISKLIWICRT